MENCNSCEYFSYDYSNGTSECRKYDDMTEEEIDKYYTNGEDNCPEYKEYKKQINMKNNYTEISIEEAKELYCNGNNKIYICNNKRKYWKLPESYQYSSHAPDTELFERSIPKSEGDTKFYK